MTRRLGFLSPSPKTPPYSLPTCSPSLLLLLSDLSAANNINNSASYRPSRRISSLPSLRFSSRTAALPTS